MVHCSREKRALLMSSDTGWKEPTEAEDYLYQFVIEGERFIPAGEEGGASAAN